MKRLTMIVALVLMVAMPIRAEHITPETARTVAATFLDNNGAKSIELTDLSEEAGFPNLYIFTADDCFVVMSADDCVKPILGYSLTGNFVVEDMPESVHCWLQGYSDQIQYAIEHQAKASSETEWQWKELAEGKTGAGRATPVVSPMTHTIWKQGKPYNFKGPRTNNGTTRTYAGCVAVAMAQVMKYWNHPISGTGSHSYTWNNQTVSANFGETTYDWNNMPNSISEDSPENQIDAVATLIFHCGASINTEYSSTSSSMANTPDVMSALQTYFGYSTNMQYKVKDEYSDSLWIAMLKTELDEGRPLQYRGGDANGAKPGHSFVCDGYDDHDYFHFNWGWGGSHDGFFSVNSMAPGDGGVYTVEESAIFGIEPVKSLPIPTLSASINKKTITLSWNTVEGATSYDVYKDNKKVTSTTSNTFRDSDTEFGTYYEYYIKAVFSSTERSNSSNRVTKCPLYRDIKPSNLTANLENDNITLTWDGYSENLSTDLHYGTVMSFHECGTDLAQDAYWGQRYPKDKLSQLKGMSITKITACFYWPGNYTMYLYSGDRDGSTRVKLAEQTFTKTASIEWKEFIFNTPIEIDCSKDLWVVFSADKSISEPILTSIVYNQDDANDAKYISTTLNGLFSSESIAEGDVSWLIRTYVTDGTCSYNLYDGNTKVNGDEPISGTNYTVDGIPNDAALQYTVKTSFNGSESEASNMVGFIVGNARVESLDLEDNDKMTLTENSMLTVTKELNCTNSDNLVLENGAQLFTNSKNVNATVKKTITGHKKEPVGGWNFIASPITKELSPKDSNGLINEFDLYRFNQNANGREWQNYKNEEHTSGFNFENSQGYLYANDKTVDLSFAGPLYNGDGIFDLAYNKGMRFAGWNLVGNPFPCNAYIDMPFYVIKDKQLVPYIGTNPIPPCTGVMVHADESGEKIRFMPIDPSNPTAPVFQPNQLHLTVVQNITDRNGVSSGSTTIEDNAFVSFVEGNQLEKFVFDADVSQLYIPQDGRDYAIAISDGQGEVSVNFQAAENGSYTLTIVPEGVEMNYLHLIDNLTGNDVDLLATSDYIFTAKTTDYPSRFRLLFSIKGNEDDNEANDFAYYSNGEIRVVEICNDVSLQIVDMTGRVVLVSKDVARNVSTNGMTPGLYVLRLINGNNVKTQKIIVY